MFPATNLAMNTYFRKKRNIAMGLSVTLTGLGPILMPLLIVKLLENYATTGTLLILSAISMHSLIGASLLKPFKEKQVSLITFLNVFSFFFLFRYSFNVDIFLSRYIFFSISFNLSVRKYELKRILCTVHCWKDV